MHKKYDGSGVCCPDKIPTCPGQDFFMCGPTDRRDWTVHQSVSEKCFMQTVRHSLCP